jgi:hypothetical protein
MNRMNASDIVKAKQNKTLFAAYYHPAVTTSTTSTTIYTSSIVQSYLSGVTPVIQSTVCSTVLYQNLCDPTVISYELANDIEAGKYECRYYTLGQFQGRNIIPTSTLVNNPCHISFMEWKNTNSTMSYQYSTTYNPASTLSTISVTSSFIQTAPGPVICPLISFYQGPNTDDYCQNRNC